MNNATVVAILEIKGVVTREEGERLVEFFNNRPQPTLLADAVEQLTMKNADGQAILDAKPSTSILSQVKAGKKKQADAVEEQNEIDRAVGAADAANKSKSDPNPQK